MVRPLREPVGLRQEEPMICRQPPVHLHAHPGRIGRYDVDDAELSDDLRMIQGHISDRHYDAADTALADEADLAKGKA